jgi:hypothetical protein
MVAGSGDIQGPGWETGLIYDILLHSANPPLDSKRLAGGGSHSLKKAYLKVLTAALLKILSYSSEGSPALLVFRHHYLA